MSLLSITFFIVGASIIGALLVIIRAHQYPAKVRKAQEYLDNGDIAKASEIVKLVLERKKDYIPARYLRAQILIQQKHLKIMKKIKHRLILIVSFLLI